MVCRWILPLRWKSSAAFAMLSSSDAVKAIAYSPDSTRYGYASKAPYIASISDLGSEAVPPPVVL